MLVLLCVCVVTQMLGAPFTLLSLLNSDMLAESEPISEDLSACSPSLEAERSRLVHLLTAFRPLIHLPTLRTSVFHPPSASSDLPAQGSCVLKLDGLVSCQKDQCRWHTGEMARRAPGHMQSARLVVEMTYRV